jgi:hypothetical protein
MNRTPTALNKALTRFGIRRERSKEEKSTWNDFGQIKSKATLNPLLAIRRFDRKFRTQQKAQINQWAPMADILAVLDAQGHRVLIAHADKNPRFSTYTIDGRKTGALQLVFIANRYRIEQNKTPFFVGHVTCGDARC